MKVLDSKKVCLKKYFIYIYIYIYINFEIRLAPCQPYYTTNCLFVVMDDLGLVICYALAC